MHRDNDRPHTPTAIYGIDFSGALDAGRKIWISLAMVKDDALEIRDCFQGFSLPNSGRRLHDCLAALVTFIASHRNSLFGIDFPFGIPHELLRKSVLTVGLNLLLVFRNNSAAHMNSKVNARRFLESVRLREPPTEKAIRLFLLIICASFDKPILGLRISFTRC